MLFQANKACKALGSATLATIEDNTANNFIKGKLDANSWIGYTDAAKVSTEAPQLRATLVAPRFVYLGPSEYLLLA